MFSSAKKYIIFGIILLFIAFREIGSVFFIDIDIRVLSVILFSILLFNYIFYETKKIKNINIFAISILFLIYSFISLKWSPSESYGSSKLLIMAPSLLVVFLLPNFILRNILLFQTLIFYTAIAFIIYIYFSIGVDILLTTSNRFTIIEDVNPIKLARFFGFTIISSIFFLRAIKPTAIPRTLLVVSILLMFLLMLFTGSKGPVFSLVISLIALYLIEKRIYFGFIIFFMVGVLISLILKYLLDFSTAEFFMFRFNIEVDSNYSVESRSTFIEHGFNMFTSSNFSDLLFGHGIGSFDHIPEIDVKYPHNIVLELLYEFGILVLFIFIYFLVKTFHGLFLLKSDDVSKYLMVMILFLFIISLTTGDISGNYLLFWFMAMGYYKI